jgi:hypothetical protein
MPPKKLTESQVARLSIAEVELLLLEWKVSVPSGAKILMKRALLDAAMSGDKSVCQADEACVAVVDAAMSGDKAVCQADEAGDGQGHGSGGLGDTGHVV